MKRREEKRREDKSVWRRHHAVRFWSEGFVTKVRLHPPATHLICSNTQYDWRGRKTNEYKSTGTLHAKCIPRRTVNKSVSVCCWNELLWQIQLWQIQLCCKFVMRCNVFLSASVLISDSVAIGVRLRTIENCATARTPFFFWAAKILKFLEKKTCARTLIESDSGSSVWATFLLRLGSPPFLSRPESGFRKRHAFWASGKLDFARVSHSESLESWILRESRILDVWKVKFWKSLAFWASEKLDFARVSRFGRLESWILRESRIFRVWKESNRESNRESNWKSNRNRTEIEPKSNR